MTHCVPDWDGHGGELDAIIATTEYLPAVTGKWGSLLLPKGSPASNLASLQSSDVPSGWTEIGPVALKSDVHGAKSPEWQVNCNNWAISRPGTAAAIPPPKPATSEQLPSVVSNGVLAVNVPVIDPTMNSTMIADDEMVSWLQYPLDDTLEKSYCSEFFGDIPNSTVASVQAIKDSLAVGQHPTHAGRLGCRTLATVPGGMNGSMSRVVSADAAMAMGAGRAAGFLPQAGVEAFTKVRTQQPYAGKWCVSSSTAAAAASNLGRTVEASTSVSHQHHQQHQQQQQPSRESPVMGMGTSSALPNVSSSPALAPLKAQAAPLQFTTAQKTRNFSHFSLPVVNMKASLQCLGVSHGSPAQNRLRTSYQLPSMLNASGRPFDAAASSGSSIAESTTTRLNSEEASRDESDVRGVEGPSEQQPSLAIEATSWPSAMPTNSLSTKGTAEVPVSSIAGNHADFESRVADPHESRPVEAENGQNSNDRSNAAATPSTTDTTATPRTQNPEAPEPTLTSSSGGSGNTSKGVVAKRKRRTREQEESEIQSEDAEDEVVELKKPQQRTNNSKRSRAAEVHNLSERRRRDRINEKMKALQELIPNSNKADKASMLDEAIEYLKMLRIQLQMMSMRSGMSIPLIPNGMQHLQVPQMGGMPPIGMGLGMGLGLGMVGMGGMGGMGPMPMGHMLDMNSMAAAGRTSHLIPHLSHAHGGAASHSGSPMMPHHQMPSHGGASYNVSQVMPHLPAQGGSSRTTVSATSPAVSMVDSQDRRLQSNSASALESVYLARQHSLQLTPQTMDVYNAYMIHQQQQQQHQYQQQQHQHQQQHQVHHLASNLGGGGLQ